MSIDCIYIYYVEIIVLYCRSFWTVGLSIYLALKFPLFLDRQNGREFHPEVTASRGHRAKAEAVGSCRDCCVADFCRCQRCECWQILRSLGYRTPYLEGCRNCCGLRNKIYETYGIKKDSKVRNLRS